MGSRVFVGGLTYNVKERDLEKFFRKCGRITEIAMKNGFAFVEFEDYRDADDAIYELNGKQLLGEKVSVERARGIPRGGDQWRGRGASRGYGSSSRRRDDDGRDSSYRSQDKNSRSFTRTEHRLIVKNLSSQVSWQDLKDYMRKAGEVTFADAHKKFRNEGVVEFASYSDMMNAVEKLDDSELNGRRIRLVEDDSRRDGRHSRSASSHRSRSRSRGHSRSRSRRRSHSRSRSLSRSKSRSRSRSRSHSKRPESRAGSRDSRSSSNKN